MDRIPSLSEWPADLRELYEERAGIKQFQGNMDQSKAEAQALSETWPQAGLFQ